MILQNLASIIDLVDVNINLFMCTALYIVPKVCHSPNKEAPEQSLRGI